MPDPLISLLVAALIAVIGALLFWPERGLFWYWQRVRRLTGRVLSEDVLKRIHDCELNGRRPTIESIAGALNISADEAADLLTRMEAHDLVLMKGDAIRLTPQGRDYALQIIRAHRLWERYLADETGFDEVEWHAQAERYEHRLSATDLDALAAQLGHPTHDPHGDPIPTASGELVTHGGQPLTAVGLDEPVRIVHLEDEPEVVYAQLVAEGLHPGMEVRVTEMTPQRIRFWAAGDEHVLAPMVAAHISVAALPEGREGPGSYERLADLRPGERGDVVSISPACRGLERRRLMDLGVLRGTTVEAELRNARGDLTAYRVRGALIALRREQAEFINITRLDD